MRILACFFLLTALALADVPWGDEIIMKTGGHRNLPGGMQLSVISIGDGATVALGPQSRRLKVGETLDTGTYRVYLEGVSDDQCVIRWVRSPGLNQALELLAAYEWTPAGMYKDESLDVPAELTGPPFTFYQSASRRIGLDLRAAAGKKVTVRQYRVTDVTANAYQVYCYMAIYEGHIVGAWVATDGPLAPGVASLLDKRQVITW